MKRTALALILAALAPLAFGQADDTGALPVRTPDRSTTCTLDSLNDTCSVALEGRSSIGLQVSTTNLNATLTPYASYDGGATWVNSYLLFNVFSYAETAGAVFSGGAATNRYELRGPAGATHARVEVTAYASGTSTAIIGARAAEASHMFAHQAGGSSDPWFVVGPSPDGTAVFGEPVRIGGKNGSTTQDILTDTDGRLETMPGKTTSANNDGACVSVAASTTVLASLATRKAFTLFARETNTDVVYIKMGATATSADFPLPAGSAYNMQAGVVYTGVIDAIAASGTQSVCVLEF